MTTGSLAAGVGLLIALTTGMIIYGGDIICFEQARQHSVNCMILGFGV